METLLFELMRVKKRIPLGVLTVATTPHRKDGSTYRSLLKAAFDVGKPIRIRGDEFAFLASCVDLDENVETPDLTGEIHKFTDISDEDWENIKNRKAATADDLLDLKIPDHLKPNREAFRYIFFVREHRFVVQLRGKKRSISHAGVRALLETLFSARQVKEHFPMVSVTIEQEPDSLDRIFALPQLNHLEIELERPNPDDVGEDEEAFVERLLAKQGAKSLKVELAHAPGQSLKPDGQNTKLARVARSYGRVKAKGRDENNRPVDIDTSDHPISEPFDYDTKAKVSFVDQMRAAATKLVNRLLKRKPQSADDNDSKKR